MVRKKARPKAVEWFQKIDVISQFASRVGFRARAHLHQGKNSKVLLCTSGYYGVLGDVGQQASGWRLATAWIDP